MSSHIIWEFFFGEIFGDAFHPASSHPTHNSLPTYGISWHNSDTWYETCTVKERNWRNGTRVRKRSLWLVATLWWLVFRSVLLRASFVSHLVYCTYSFFPIGHVDDDMEQRIKNNAKCKRVSSDVSNDKKKCRRILWKIFQPCFSYIQFSLKTTRRTARMIYFQTDNT